MQHLLHLEEAVDNARSSTLDKLELYHVLCRRLGRTYSYAQIGDIKLMMNRSYESRKNPTL